jgi:hypothetical protein
MAVARCKTCGTPQGLKKTYNYVHVVASSVKTEVLCGTPMCVHPAFIWFTDAEENEYRCGQRSFRVSNHTLRVEVT